MMVVYEVLLNIDDKGLTSLKREYEERVATIDFLTHQDVHLAYRHLLILSYLILSYLILSYLILSWIAS